MYIFTCYVSKLLIVRVKRIYINFSFRINLFCDIKLHAIFGYQQRIDHVGINTKTIDKYFPNTPSRVQGIGLREIEKEIVKRHKKSFQLNDTFSNIEIGGDYRWRRGQEKHQFNPLTVAKLQESVRTNKTSVFKEYSDLINKQSKSLMTIRGLFEFDQFDPIPLDEVEPWTAIVKRFKTGAMSYGSISKEAHENLAIAMNRIGGKSD